MPEPTGPVRGVPPYPPTEHDVPKGVSDDIGYGHGDPETDRKLQDLREQEEVKRQQETNQRGVETAKDETPDGKREAELVAKRESGQSLDREEIQFLAVRRAKRETRQ